MNIKSPLRSRDLLVLCGQAAAEINGLDLSTAAMNVAGTVVLVGLLLGVDHPGTAARLMDFIETQPGLDRGRALVSDLSERLDQLLDDEDARALVSDLLSERLGQLLLDDEDAGT